MKSRIIATVITIAMFAWLAPVFVRAQSTPGFKSGRPLPHPDILELPEDDASPASEEAHRREALPPAPATGPEKGGSAESKPIARPSEPAGPVSATGNESRSLTRRDVAGKSGLFRDLWPLLAVLVVIAGMAVLLKKFMPARRLLTGTGVLQIVARTPIGAKQQIVLVKLGRKLVLIGVSPERMSTLCSVDDPDQVALLLGEAASGRTNSMSRAFEASMRAEAEDYVEATAEDETSRAGGQLHGLLQKVRTMAAKTG